MASILADVERLVRPGMVIPKPEAKADFIIKGWGQRRGERALIYTIPNRSTPQNPYEKGITMSEWVHAARQLTSAGEFTHSWFKEFMPRCSKEGSCNFTTIGGVFEVLKYANYERRGSYRRRPGYEGETGHP
jgi:hypothetical protein